MHRALVNRLEIDLALEPRGAFAVRSGDKAAAMLNPWRPDLQVLRQGTGTGETVFIPGSSLKGVCRSHTERILRSLGASETAERWMACDPLDHRSPCHSVARGTDSAETHSQQCLACRTFGSQQIRSRASFTDAFPTVETLARANEVDERSGVAIDRKSGGPSRGKLFQTEVVTGGAFACKVHAHNLQAWQVALLLTVLEDIDAGQIRVGGATTRGLGHMKIVTSQVKWWQISGDRPAGLGALRPDLVADYGLLEDGAIAVHPDAKQEQRLGPSWTWTGTDALKAIDGFRAIGEQALLTHAKRKGAA